MVHPLIAVVDDDRAFLEMMTDGLATEGYRSMVLADAEQAVSALGAAQPALIMLDVNLGGRLNGWDVLGSLRQTPETERIPVIVLSADARNLLLGDPPHPTRGVDVLEKPFRWSVLQYKIEHLIQHAITA